MYDPVMGSYVHGQQEVPVVPFVIKNNNVLCLNDSFLTHLQILDQSCGYADYRNKYLTFPPPGRQPAKFFNLSSPSDQACDLWNFANNAALLANPYANVYQIATYCPLPSDPLGFPTDLMYSYPGLTVYFNRADVKYPCMLPQTQIGKNAPAPPSSTTTAARKTKATTPPTPSSSSSPK